MKATFDDLYHKYHQDLYQFVFYMVKNKQEAEDIIQEVYIRVLKSYDKFNGDSSEKTWLFSIARHVSYDYFRKLKRKRSRFLSFFNWSEAGETLPSHNPIPEEVAVLDDEMKHLYYALDKCTPDQKHVIILRYLQEFSIQETSEILGWSTSKVKTTQHRAIKLLQDLMGNVEDKEDV
ncbi:sigma-70 family RNA polymerase sigma factor [Gracilibacillus oryzae]|uniref:RNA polymerase sigma factor n=1 Tax=Gracilibacillus oryzae TaxID=1672701 RepID=A0A7C8GVJ9_9BACI|nr:RNA polymerase sigma factor SigX [Gracilibacillus oryzae]KAB8138368.1 sigma-70 family RNA polymerase sigma factor [Gracilibacillus oryzae]